MSQEQEPKTLREILLWYMGEIQRGTDKVLCDWDPKFERDLLAWAKAYGKQVREACITEIVRSIAALDADFIDESLSDLKLPEPT